jgi:vacuolar-type H+-ATPase subunit H
MIEMKYTSDGRKVIVVGKLNAQETIVQEIFVSAGNEIPSGENFVVKSLHDAPSKSWKETHTAEIEARYESKKAEIECFEKAVSEKKKLLSARLDSLSKMVEGVSLDSFQLLSDVICGNITHIVVESYSSEIMEWDRFVKTDEYSQDRLRLISVYGCDDGSLKFYQGKYSDGSGGNGAKFIPCKSLEEAVLKFEQVLLNINHWDENTILRAEKYGIKLPSDRVEEVKKRRRDQIQEAIDGHSKCIEKKKEELKNLK